MNVQDCYRILRISPGAGLDEIKAAFRKQAFQLHPDLNPSADAAARFREVNEAYVLLTQIMKGDSSARPGTQSGTRPGKADSNAQNAAQAKAQKAKAEKAYSQQKKNAGSGWGGAGNSTTGATGGNFYFREEEVLRDLLSDPFARQVFEDIYSQLKNGRTSGPRAPGAPGAYGTQPGAQGNLFRPRGMAPQSPPAPIKRRRLNIQWGDKSLDLDMSKGLIGGIKGWMRGQLDHEQTVTFPVSALGPGRAVRLSISTRFGETKTVEVTLPPDFVVGRPIRLKGLGRKLGPFTGDLILRVLAR